MGSERNGKMVRVLDRPDWGAEIISHLYACTTAVSELPDATIRLKSGSTPRFSFQLNPKTLIARLLHHHPLHKAFSLSCTAYLWMFYRSQIGSKDVHTQAPTVIGRQICSSLPSLDISSFSWGHCQIFRWMPAIWYDLTLFAHVESWLKNRWIRSTEYFNIDMGIIITASIEFCKLLSVSVSIWCASTYRRSWIVPIVPRLGSRSSAKSVDVDVIPRILLAGSLMPRR